MLVVDERPRVSAGSAACCSSAPARAPRGGVLAVAPLIAPWQPRELRRRRPDAAARAAVAQPLWANVPAAARARYLRRAARRSLDELDDIALLLARETGRPRTEAVLGELLPPSRG